MADNKKDVTLVIRADNKAKAEFEKLVDLVKKVEAGFDKTSDSADDLGKSIATLSSGAAGQFFLKTEQAVSKANLEYKKSQVEIKQLAARLRELRDVQNSSVGPFQPAKVKEFNSEIKKVEGEFVKTQALLQRQSAEYRNQLALLRQIRTATSANNAAAFKARVAAIPPSTGGGIPAASRGGGGAPSLPGLPAYDPKGPRQTLDFYQRIRGQVLALTSSYFGVYGAVNQFNKALEEQAKTQGIRASLGATLGTQEPKAITAEMERMRREAERLGAAFLPMADSFARFNASARLSGASGATVNTVFRNISEAGTVLNLSTEELQGTFLGLTQIFNKQKVTAEDFRGQVAERLPGAMAVLAKSLKVPVEELDGLFQKGAIGAEAMVEFSQLYQQQVQEGLIPATQRLSADIERLGNDAVDLRKTFVDSATPGLMEAIGTLRETIADPEFRANMKSLGETVGWVAKQLASLAPAIPALASLVAAMVAFRAAQGLRTLFDFVNPKNINLAITAISSLNAMLGASTLAARATSVSYITLAGAARALWLALTGPVGAVVAAVAAVGVAYEVMQAKRKKQHAEEAEAAANEIKRLDESKRKEEEKLALLEAQTNARKRALAALDEEVAKVKEMSAAEGDPAEKAKQERDARDEAIYRSRNAAVNQELSLNPTLLLKETEAFKKAKEGLLASEEIYQKELKEIRSKASDAQKVKDDKIAKDAEDALMRRLDLERDINALSGAGGTKTIDEKRTALQDELETMSERINKSKEFNDEEKKILAAKLQQAAATRDQQILEEELSNGIEKQVQQANLLTQARDARIRTIAAEGEASGRSPDETARLIREEYEKTTTAILAAIDAEIRLQEVRGGPEAMLRIEVLKAERAELLAIPATLNEIGIQAQNLKEQFAEGLADGMLEFAKGAKTAREALKDFATDFLSFIAQAIIKKMILNAIESSSGAGGVFSSIAGVMHTGGIVGAGSGMSRSVNPAAFAGAARYHSGGMPGLKPDEVATILQKGEEVLPQNDPRHAANINKSVPAAAPQFNVKMVNAIDSAAMWKEGLAAPGTDRVFLNYVRANKTAFRQALG